MNLVTEAYLAANFTPKSGTTPGSDDHIVLNSTEILARYNVSISPSTGKYCPKQSELAALLSVGDTYRGGIIAYFFVPGDTGYISGEVHGIIVSSTDLGNAAWGCHGTLLTGADGVTLGTGAQNTLDIISGCSQLGTAARDCANYSNGGFSDWWLPSIDELQKVYSSGLTGFASDYFWTSTQYNSSSAYAISWVDGTISTIYKYTTDRVRAVRNF